ILVEDNKELAHNIQTFLEKEGFICETSFNYAEALDKLASFEYDIVILDIMLPDRSGLQLLEWIKREKIESGILIISARNAVDDKINGLELGADDYLTKPFHLTELNARLKAIY